MIKDEEEIKTSNNKSTVRNHNALVEKIDNLLGEKSKDKPQNMDQVLEKTDKEEIPQRVETGVSEIDLDKIEGSSDDIDSAKLVDERSGFGWKGLGFRRIYYKKELDESTVVDVSLDVVKIFAQISLG